MSKEVKKKLVPELRFPEFSKEGDWDYINGDKVFDAISNKDHNSDLPILAITQDHGAIPRDWIDYNVVVSEKSVASYKVVEEGDFIISLRSFQGGIEYSNYKGLCSPAYIILRKKLDVDSDFYRHYFKSGPFIKDLNRNLEGIRDGKMVSYKQFSEILIPKPKKEEQQKIASCLSSIDNLIEVETQKLEALNDHKKGLMQNLFPQEGEMIPKLRFPEFKDSGEWRETSLGNCLSQKPEYGINAAAVPYSDELPTYLRITDISEDGKFISNQKVSVEKEVTPENYLNEGDIVLARTGASVGKSYKYKIQDGKLVFAGFLIRIKPNSKKIDSEFLYQHLSSPNYWNWVGFISTRSGQPGINGTEYSTMPVSLPPAMVEQQKIASCFSSLDALITAQADKIERLNDHKKGLMQNLFPLLVD